VCVDFGREHEEERKTGKYDSGRIRAEDSVDVCLQHNNAQVGSRWRSSVIHFVERSFPRLLNSGDKGGVVETGFGHSLQIKNVAASAKLHW
jgi:hypothetical protein